MIDSIAQSYGVADSPLQQDQVQLEFAQIELGHQFLNRVKEFCAQIQILIERFEQVAHKLTYAQAFESCIFTETLLNQALREPSVIRKCSIVLSQLFLIVG